MRPDVPEAPLATLRGRAVRATAWSAADMAIRQGAQLAILIILARLVAPAEFGSFALLSIFLGIATVFVEGGFSSALIQKRDATQTDESTVFWINLATGTLMFVVLSASAPGIASFFDVPELMWLTVAVAINVLISSAGSIHATLISKHLRFRQLLFINTCGTLAAGVVAIAAASAGAGVWALAAQSLTMTSVSTALLWTSGAWRPTREFSLASARTLFRFGGFLFVSGLLDVAYTRGYTVLIGRLYDVRQVGYYNRATTTQQVPTSILTEVLARVAFPVFASAKTDRDALRRGVQMSVSVLMLLNAPIMLGLAAVADPLLVTVFGDAWAPAAPLLRILCLAGLLWPLQVINLNVLLAQGRSDLFFRLEVVKKSAGIALLILGAFFGLRGIATSQVVFAILAFFVNAHYTGRFLGYGALAQIRDFMPSILIAVPMTTAVVIVSARWPAAPAIKLVALVAGGAALFLLVGLIIRPSPVREALNLLRPAQITTDLEST